MQTALQHSLKSHSREKGRWPDKDKCAKYGIDIYIPLIYNVCIFVIVYLYKQSSQTHSYRSKYL